ncbi:hypothetical protein BHMPCIPO_03315 [Ensifer sesbaniae]|nr:hypothetical protein [Ensifer sesbaniae]
MTNLVRVGRFPNPVCETPGGCKPMAYRHLNAALVRAPPFAIAKKPV